MIDIKVPTVGESINEVTLLKWTKQDGDYVERDEVIAELESEKATFEVNAEQSGILKTSAAEGDTLKIGDLLASIDESAAKPQAKTEEKAEVTEEKKVEKETAAAKSETPKSNGQEKKEKKKESKPASVVAENDIKASPVASAMLADKGVDP